MKIHKTRSKSAMQGFAFVCFFFLIVLYGQNAHALAMAESTAYFDWGTLNISGAGTVSYTGQYSTYEAGYTTPNNNNDTSPIFSPNNWSDAQRKRENPAGTVYGDAKAEEIGGGNTNQGVFGNVFAQSDGISFGDIDVEQYSGSATTTRGGEFTVDQTGTYTFSLDYSLYQHISVQDYVHDIAITTSSVYFYAGNDALTDYDIDWDTFMGIDDVLEYDAPWEDYDQTYNDAGTFTFTMDLVAGNDYFFNTEIYNFARAGSYGLTTPQPGPVPEPATILLLGSGLAGAVLTRRKKNIAS